ncbi:SHOCT domain-containing protein [Nocardioides sp. W7]|uniref:SHOCT domain-containing protein n=1 Tax=Nocardioides sp. W7 TaxID=2931390 RepID=UPI001FD03B16|nr:SHOCT domain-containing protein [Nocardioides sp. W7]
MVTVWEYSPGDVFVSMVWFFLFFIWISLLISVFADIFRSEDLSGWSKALWTLFVIVLPYLGVFVYLIARGKTMGQRAVSRADRYDRYDQTAAAPSTAQELERLAELQRRGDLSETEFQQAKAKLLA